MESYVRLNARAQSCTVATVSPSGRRLHSQVAETNAGALIRVQNRIKSLFRHRSSRPGA